MCNSENYYGLDFGIRIEIGSDLRSTGVYWEYVKLSLSILISGDSRGENAG